MTSRFNLIGALFALALFALPAHATDVAAYVAKDGNGNIISVQPSPGPGLTQTTYGDAAVVAFFNPPALAQFNANILAGITITNGGANSVPVATFALDTTTQNQFAFIAGSAGFLGAFPGGATFVYPDMTGNPQTFPSVAAFRTFYAAYSGLLLQMNTTLETLQAGGSASWPSQSIALQ